MKYASLPFNNIFNGCILSREQYECCKDYVKDSICIGIDCYSKFFLKSNDIFYFEKFCFSVAIREQSLFKDDEAGTLKKLKEKYSDVLTVKNFKELNSPFFISDFFGKLRMNSQYMYEIKSARKEILCTKQIISIRLFDEYLTLVLDRLEYETDRYTAFNTIMKGYEAIIHYICAFYLCHLEIKLSDCFGKVKVIDKVENGSLGAWLELTYSILKSKNYLNTSFLKCEIGNNICELFSKIDYPANKIKESDKISSKESWYNFLNNRLVNLRNTTVGHGSTAFIPSDEGLVSMYKIFLYMINKVRINLNNLKLTKEVFWIIEINNEIAFLDKLTPEINELRYIDYLSEKSVPMPWRSGKDVFIAE